MPLERRVVEQDRAIGRDRIKHNRAVLRVKACHMRSLAVHGRLITNRKVLSRQVARGEDTARHGHIARHGRVAERGFAARHRERRKRCITLARQLRARERHIPCLGEQSRHDGTREIQVARHRERAKRQFARIRCRERSKRRGARHGHHAARVHHHVTCRQRTCTRHGKHARRINRQIVKRCIARTSQRTRKIGLPAHGKRAVVDHRARIRHRQGTEIRRALFVRPVARNICMVLDRDRTVDPVRHGAALRHLHGVSRKEGVFAFVREGRFLLHRERAAHRERCGLAANRRAVGEHAARGFGLREGGRLQREAVGHIEGRRVVEFAATDEIAHILLRTGNRERFGSPRAVV